MMMDRKIQPKNHTFPRGPKGEANLISRLAQQRWWGGVNFNLTITLSQEIPEENIGDVQPLHEEIKLHSRVRTLTVKKKATNKYAFAAEA